jgi:hypothetical protein
MNHGSLWKRQGNMIWNNIFNVRFEVFTMVTIKNAVVWDVKMCGSCVNRRFGLHSTATHSSWFLVLGFFYPEDDTLRCPETLVHTRSTQHNIPEDGILQYFKVLLIKRFRKLFYFLICFVKPCLTYPHADFATECTSSPGTACGC